MIVQSTIGRQIMQTVVVSKYIDFTFGLCISFQVALLYIFTAFLALVSSQIPRHSPLACRQDHPPLCTASVAVLRPSRGYMVSIWRGLALLDLPDCRATILNDASGLIASHRRLDFH